MYNYTQLLERISSASKMTLDDIERKIEAKRAKLSGLVSKEGAAQIVAAELGIHFDKERMKIAELVQGMRRVNVLGKIIEVFPVRSYNKNGREGKVGSFLLADESGNTRAVLWDTHHISLVENGEIGLGSAVELSNASVRNSELHLSAFSDIKKSNESIGEVVKEKQFTAHYIKDAKPGVSLKTRAFILQMFEPRYFEVCPDCSKKAVEGICAVHGKVLPQRRALLNVVIDDGTGSLRSVLFLEQLRALGLDDESIFSIEKFALQKQQILGEEKFFSGNIKNNSLYNTLEFNIGAIENFSVDALLKEFEGRA